METKNDMCFSTWNYKIGIQLNHINLTVLKLYALQLQAIPIISSELDVYSL